MLAVLATRAAPASPHADLPVTIQAQHSATTLFVPVRVNGSRPRWFVLDSGASSCVLDLATAQALALAPVGTGEGHGAGAGSYPYVRYDSTAVRFELGGQRFRCDRVIGIDLSGQPAIVGRPVEGIL